MLPLIDERTKVRSISGVIVEITSCEDVIDNRRRVQELFQCIDDAEDNEEDIWKLLARQGLITDEQLEKLSKLDNTDIETIASTLKGVEIGQGIPFLPTSLKGLRTIFGALWTEFTKHGSEMMKNKLLPVLKELLHRRGITDEQYKTRIVMYFSF